MVNEGKVEIVDEFTGRILHGRRYSDGLHQAIEAKEHIRIAERNRTLATITFQNYFRMYKKLAGMTGTAETEATEFAKIYGLDVAVDPDQPPGDPGGRRRPDLPQRGGEAPGHRQEIARAAQARASPCWWAPSPSRSPRRSPACSPALGVRHEVLNAKNHAREALIIAEAGAARRGDHRHEHGRPRHGHQAGRQPRVPRPAQAGRPGRRSPASRCWPGSWPPGRATTREVKQAGGLHVLGTERHEARRIDNQLRGRSGRQGDPGSSRFYISLDDDLMRLFGGENLKGVMSRLGMKEGEPIYHPWVNKAIERAQKRVEERNFEIRKHLLEYDDVLNEQRKFIYARRDEILADENLSRAAC